MGVMGIVVCGIGANPRPTPFRFLQNQNVYTTKHNVTIEILDG